MPRDEMKSRESESDTVLDRNRGQLIGMIQSQNSRTKALDTAISGPARVDLDQNLINIINRICGKKTRQCLTDSAVVEVAVLAVDLVLSRVVLKYDHPLYTKYDSLTGSSSLSEDVVTVIAATTN